MSWHFTSGGQSIGALASASVSPVNIQCWFPLELTGLIFLQPKRLSRVFSSTAVWRPCDKKGQQWEGIPKEGIISDWISHFTALHLRAGNVSTPTITDFKLLMGCRWTQSCEEMLRSITDDRFSTKQTTDANYLESIDTVNCSNIINTWWSFIIFYLCC